MDIFLNVVSTYNACLFLCYIRSNKREARRKKLHSRTILQLQLLHGQPDLLLLTVLPRLGCGSGVSVQGAVLSHQQPPGPASTLNVSPVQNKTLPRPSLPSTHRGPPRPRPRPTVAGPGCVPGVEGAVLAQQQQAAPAPVPGLGLVTCSCSVHLDTTLNVGYHLDFTDFTITMGELI